MKGQKKAGTVTVKTMKNSFNFYNDVQVYYKYVKI